MPEKTYRIYLDGENSIFVYVETEHGEVTSFVVKYLSVIDDEETEILQYDSAHDMPHIDVQGPDGKTKQKIWLPHLTNKEALSYAKKDIRQFYRSYREKFIQWKNEKKKER